MVYLVYYLSYIGVGELVRGITVALKEMGGIE